VEGVTKTQKYLYSCILFFPIRIVPLPKFFQKNFKKNLKKFFKKHIFTTNFSFFQKPTQCENPPISQKKRKVKNNT